MRRIDKKLNMMKVNLLAESRYLELKGLIKESSFEASNMEDTNVDKIEHEGDVKRLFEALNHYTRPLVEQLISEWYIWNPAKRPPFDKKLETEEGTKVRLQSTSKNIMNNPGIFLSINSKTYKLSTFAIDYIREYYLNNVQGGELDENRFSHPKREYEELLKNDDIKGFVDRFHQYRDKALANVGMEIRPVFSEVDVRFVDKKTPTSGGNNFFDTRIKSDATDYESGQIMFKYNDITCLFTGKLQGDSILYTYDKSLKTNYNKPTTVEALRVANEFEKMCESFTFRLRKDEVPTVFYKK